MRVGRLHQITLALTVTVSVLGMFNGSTLTATGALITIAVVAATVGQLHQTKRSWARAAFVHGTTLIGLAFAVFVFQRARIDAVLIVVMLGVINRFALRAGHRDDLIIFGATFVLMVATTTIAPGVEFLAMLLVFVVLVFWGLWVSSLLASAPHDRTRPVPPQLGRLAVWGLSLTVAGFLAVSLLPRYRFGRLFTTGFFAQLAGASTTMDLRTGGVRSPSGGTAVLRLEPNDPNESGRVEGLYARLFVLDHFDGRGFSAIANGRSRLVYHNLDQYRGALREFAADDAKSVVRLTLDRMARQNRAHPVALIGRNRPGFVKLPRVRETGSGAWVASVPRASATVVYKVDLDNVPPILPWPSKDAARVRSQVLQLPDELDPRLTALAASLTNDTMSTGEKISAVLRHFDRGFVYSLEPLEGESEDPLVRFLFEAKAGHCELYAGATTVLLRLAGVQSRVVTGYYGGRWNDAAGHQEMTDDDAHAWVEVYDESTGWRWVDATPESERSRRVDNALAWLSDLYKAAEKFWYDKIVDFDESKRAALLSAAKNRVRALEAAVLPGPMAEGGRTTNVLPAASVLMLIAIGLVVIVLARRRRARQPAQVGARLRRALGASIDSNRTLGALLADVDAGRFDVAAQAVAVYEVWRFGTGAKVDELPPVLDAIRAVERWRAPTT